ncbi:hypothetical protein ACUN24_09195 [Pedobacter sp. WC2501]|uniref:hypothetical protein n=1 Tax=Pedobacter sp. WC2501 TaxID=3461400 RepID=UPI00404534E9
MSDAQTQTKQSKLVSQFSKWCVERPLLGVLLSLALIMLGLYIHDQPTDGESSTGLLMRVHWSTVFYHFFVILGEAIFVMLVLHVFIEKANADAHMEHSQVAVKNMEVLSAAHIKELMKTFKDEGNKTIETLKHNLFAAILEDKMPAEVVQVVLENEFFNTNVLRRNLKIEFLFQSEKEKEIIITQRITFDMQYISGKDDTIEYFMPLSLSDTPVAEYAFVEANYKSLSGPPEGEYIKLTKDENFRVREYGKNNEKDTFELIEPIVLAKGETVNVEQVIEATYNLDDKGMFDSYYVNNHTIDIIVAFDLPKDYEVGIYPTFPEKLLPPVRTSANRRTYDKIRFLVPGQGFGFSIKKQ